MSDNAINNDNIISELCSELKKIREELEEQTETYKQINIKLGQL